MRGALDQTLDQKEAEKFDYFFNSLNKLRSPLLLLDYDGTLADFALIDSPRVHGPGCGSFK